ncbi:hypothetical protein A2696_03455 [Candidatus Curtissbacteria bacterium RIFCSPHIGHO2_01_FULL_41_13]|uniref:Addiction module toxin, HicA family n=1 Tax=Candidatus Curtissbacteria bacterium RIFCSPHIGHO2_01_FULL_41_13 TaxID=1797745 RepID=A0A1F5G244_9BACT|nr:MAG: hypothetical protein A2696_03455 [Candidatus Curtissbacteria bacterium RIFCSPHIGHO2_01_FULL_41_13]
MSKLPRNVRPQRLTKFLESLGFQKGRGKGSHIRMIHPDGRWTQVAVHHGPVPTGTLRKVIRQAELADEEISQLK